MNKEAEAIRKAISELTSAEYEFEEPTQRFPRPNSNVAWLLVSKFPIQGRTKAYAPTIWEDEEGMLSVRSIQLADMSEWIAETCGERGAKKSQAMEKELAEANAKDVLKKYFPRVDRRALEYEHVLADMSSKRGVSLRMEYSVNGFVISLYAIAMIDTRNMDTQAKIERIKLSIDAMEEAIWEIEKIEARRNPVGS